MSGQDCWESAEARAAAAELAVIADANVWHYDGWGSAAEVAADHPVRPPTFLEISDRIVADCDRLTDGSDDQAAADSRPDTCWRCDAVEATTDVGLCPHCHGALTAEP